MPPAFVNRLQLISNPRPATTNGKLNACYGRKVREMIDVEPGLPTSKVRSEHVSSHFMLVAGVLVRVAILHGRVYLMTYQKEAV
jgi:hypothetical protein